MTLMVLIMHNFRLLCNSLICYAFLAGYGIHAQHRCEIPWKSQIIQLSGGQSLGAKNHRLWASVI